ncbi:hypothetical protein CR513_19001, partial [Mucuna pruriens]
MKACSKPSLFTSCMRRQGFIWKKREQYARSANKGRKEVLFKEKDLKKDRFPYLRKYKLFSRGDDPFKILKKINDNVY